MLKEITVKPPMITIVGAPGSGKTSLAGMFPSPVFIQAEDSEVVFEQWEQSVRPKFMPHIQRSNVERGILPKEQVMSQLRWLMTEEHDRKTLVIDTTSTMSTKFETQLCQMHGVDNVADACGGYHKGFIALSEWHREVREACDTIRKHKNMTIIFLSHLGINKIKSAPDADEYAVYSLDMHSALAKAYINEVDCVFYIKKRLAIEGAEKDRKGRITKYGKAIDTGERILITSGDGKFGYVEAKNRYSMPGEIELNLGENPVMQYIPYYNV